MTTRHQHVCGCGDYFMCSQLPDRCPREPWQCPTCEQDQLEEWANALNTETARQMILDTSGISPTLTHKEPNRHESE